jgi:hypothetical protein
MSEIIKRIVQLRQAIALPVYTVGLLLDYLSARSAGWPPGSPATTGRSCHKMAAAPKPFR